MVQVKVGRCPKHDRFSINGICLECRAEEAEKIGRPQPKPGKGQ
jgi:hypothetical protein